MIRRKLVGGETPDRPSRNNARNKILLSRQEKRALRSLRLVEKVESIGLDIISQGHHQPVGISPLAMGSVRSRTASPMTQLTSLKNIPHHSHYNLHNARNDDPYALDRDTIRAVLNKGMSSDGFSDDVSTDGSTTSSITNRDDSDESTSATKKPPLPHHPAAVGSPARTNPAATESSRTSHTTDPRVKQLQRQKSRRMMNNAGGQRPDLGTVAGARRDLNARIRQGSVSLATEHSDDELSLASSHSVAPHQTITSFVGSISSLFFGRKGGLL